MRTILIEKEFIYGFNLTWFMNRKLAVKRLKSEIGPTIENALKLDHKRHLDRNSMWICCVIHMAKICSFKLQKLPDKWSKNALEMVQKFALKWPKTVQKVTQKWPMNRPEMAANWPEMVQKFLENGQKLKNIRKFVIKVDLANAFITCKSLLKNTCYDWQKNKKRAQVYFQGLIDPDY